MNWTVLITAGVCSMGRKFAVLPLQPLTLEPSIYGSKNVQTMLMFRTSLGELLYMLSLQLGTLRCDYFLNIVCN